MAKTASTNLPTEPAPAAPLRDVRRVENNTPRVIVLPATDSFPAGVVLRPGMNTPDKGPDALVRVPGLYFKELFSQEAVDVKGNVWYPGRKTIEDLEKVARIGRPEGGYFYSPQITIYEEDMVERPDGIIPESLDQFFKEFVDGNDVKRNVALEMLKTISDRSALARYSKESRHPEIKAAAAAKLNG